MASLIITRKDDYEIVQLDAGKVNAIDTEMVSELLAYFTQAAQDDAIRGVILAGRPNCFSAGINIKKLFMGGAKGYREYWVNYYGAVQAMANFHKPLICVKLAPISHHQRIVPPTCPTLSSANSKALPNR